MSNIRTYNDLLEEKSRLEASLVIKKEIIRNDIALMREEFRPTLNLISTVGKMANLNRSNPLIASAVNLAGELLLGNVLLSRGAKATRLIVPFLAKKASTYLFKNGGTIFQKLTGIWNKFKSNGHAAA